MQNEQQQQQQAAQTWRRCKRAAGAADQVCMGSQQPGLPAPACRRPTLLGPPCAARQAWLASDEARAGPRWVQGSRGTQPLRGRPAGARRHAAHLFIMRFTVATTWSTCGGGRAGRRAGRTQRSAAQRIESEAGWPPSTHALWYMAGAQQDRHAWASASSRSAANRGHDGGRATAQRRGLPRRSSWGS